VRSTRARSTMSGARVPGRPPEGNYFFFLRPPVRKTCVMVVFGLFVAVLFFTKRPVIAERTAVRLPRATSIPFRLAAW